MRQHQKHAFVLCAMWMMILGFVFAIDVLHSPVEPSSGHEDVITNAVDDPSASAPPTTEGVGMLDLWNELDDPVRPMNHEDKTFRLHGHTDQSFVHRTYCRLHVPPFPLIARKS